MTPPAAPPETDPTAVADWLAAFGAAPGSAPGLGFAPATLKEALDGALALGRAAGCLPEAMRLLAGGEARLAALAARLGLDRKAATAAGRPFPSVAVLASVDPPVLAGRWVPDVAEKGGGRAVLVVPGQPPQPVSRDALAAADPDVLVLAPADGRPVEAARDALRAFADSEGRRALRALREGRTWAMDGALLHRPGPNLLRAPAVLAAALHPARIGDAAPTDLLPLD